MALCNAKVPIPEFVHPAIVFGTLLAADLATLWVGKYHSPTVRDFVVHPVLKVALSYAQFTVTMMVLIGGGVEDHFEALFVIQLNPFLMTLVRRGFFSAIVGEYIYALYVSRNLLENVAEALMSNDPSESFFELEAITVLALLLRMAGISKYFVWGLVVCYYWYIRSGIIKNGILSSAGARYGWNIVHLLLLLIAIRKSIVARRCVKQD